MANKKIPDLAPISAVQLSMADLFLLDDVSVKESKKLTVRDLSSFLLISGILTSSFAGVLYGTASFANQAASTSYAPSQASCSYANTSSWAWNSITSSAALMALSTSYSVSSSNALTASFAFLAAAQTAYSAAFATAAQSCSYLIYTPGTFNGSASYSLTSGTASYTQTSTTSSNAITASVALSANTLIYNGTPNGTASAAIFSSLAYNATQSISSSHALIADVALVGYTVNSQNSASFASSSISASYASFAQSAKTASYVLPNATVTHGVFSAITHSSYYSQLDVLTLVAPGQLTASIEAAGTMHFSYTASTPYSESITLNALNRQTGVITWLDMTPVYVFAGGASAYSASMRMPYTLAGQLIADPDDYMIYVTASSNNIRLASGRTTKFAVDLSNGSTLATAIGSPMIFATDFADPITFTSADGGPFTDTAANILTTGSANIYTMDISRVNGHVSYLWTMTALTTLTALNASYLQSISGAPVSLLTMSVASGSLQSLQPMVQNTALKKLVCSNNQLTSLPSLPSSLVYLDCSKNTAITSLPTLPNLTNLYCEYLAISGPPATLPSTIVSMSFSNNSNMIGAWTTTLPSSLGYFVCANNPSLTYLPTIPAAMRYLDVSNDGLTDVVQDGICANLVSNGVTNGFLNLLGNMRPLLGTTLSRIVTLTGRGWTVYY